MFAQNLETKFFDSEDYIPTPAWIYWLLMLAGAAFGITMFLLKGVEANVHVIIPTTILFITATVIAMAMMNAVMRCNSPQQMAGSMIFALVGGALLFVISAIVCVIVLVVIAIVIGIWLLGAVLKGATAKEATVERGGLFGGTKKVMGHENWDGTFTDLDGNTYKKKDSWF